MKRRCVVCLTQRIGDLVRIQIQPAEIIKEKKEMGLKDIMGMAMGGDMEKMQKKLQQEAVLMQSPDLITIPYDEWKKYGYKLDDIVIVTLEQEE